ncbi:MAG: ABC transporter ATP-binding protein [Clostridia bacterium]|nr:ABC transporter ATP-binding protein [Clostridia bacterium]
MRKRISKKIGTLRRSARYIKPYWGYAVISGLCTLVHVASELLIPIFWGDAIDHMIGAGKVLFDGVWRYVVYIIIATLLAAVAHYFMEVSNHEIICKVGRDLRDEATEKTHRLPLSYLDTQPTGDVVSRIISDVDVFSEGFFTGFSHMLSGLLTIIGTLAILLHYNIIITLIVVALTPFSMLVTAYVAKKTRRHFIEQAEIRGEETALISELMDGQQVIHAYSHEKRSVAEFDEVNERLGKSALKATFFSSLANPCTRVVNSVIYACVCAASAVFAVGGGITVGQLSVFISHAGHYAHPFNEISGVITEVQNALRCVDRVFGLLDQPEESHESEANNAPASARGRVELKNVSFRYLPDRPVLNNISLKAEPGQRIAIVGPTGCGKTTLINLLMRFYDVDSGAIYFDGVDIKTLDRATLRKNIGMVLQDTWLHSGTIKQNIAYGNPDATDEQIIDAARAAHAHSFIRRLPDGYNTVISENGDNLSAGQKQLICLARIMLSPPPVLILDEATSSIDIRTEHKIQRALSSMMQGRTSFVVAHRLSTVKQADLILVMHEGSIVERGTHEQLLAQNGFYAAMYNSQFAEFERHN